MRAIYYYKGRWNKKVVLLIQPEYHLVNQKELAMLIPKHNFDPHLYIDLDEEEFQTLFGRCDDVDSEITQPIK